MRILGIDIGNGLAVCCPLDCLPSEPRQFNIDGANFYEFRANAEGIKGILALKPDIAIMEPTGTNYSKLWGTYLARAGVEVRLVPHHRLKAQRDDLSLPDKDDEADSFALAYYGWKHLDNELSFLQVRTPELVRLREISLRFNHLNRCQNPIVNRLKQDLAWQFPEISKKRFCRTEGMVNPPGLLRWLAGEIKKKNYDDAYKNTVGLGLTVSVRLHALRLCDYHREELILEKEAEVILNKPAYEFYRKVFNAFGFGFRTQCVLLSQIYPFEHFLDENNKPIIVIKKGKNSKKPTKRHLSRRRFEKMIGTAPTRDASGKKDKKQIIGGSEICRILLTTHVKNQCTERFGKFHVVKEAMWIWKSNKKRNSNQFLNNMNATSHLVRLLFKCFCSMINGKTPELIHYEVIKRAGYNECGFCGREIQETCPTCEDLKKRVKLFFESFI